MPNPEDLAAQIREIVRRVGVADQRNDLIGRTKGPLKLTSWERPDGEVDVTAEFDQPGATKRALVFDTATGVHVPGDWENHLAEWYADVQRYGG